MKLPNYVFNRISLVGAALSFFFIVGELCLFSLDFMSDSPNAYLQIFTYFLIPPFIFLGFALVLAGALRTRKIHRRLGTEPGRTFPFDIDLSKKSGVKVAAVGMSVFAVFLTLTVIGSYKSFHYTESVAFCGMVCHQVMKPEHTAYLNSAHARVACVDCHIGSGAEWYFKSKLTGLRQIWKATGDSYDRPISTPIHDLRPAQETCTQCHWSQKRFGSFDLNREYFLKGGGDKSWRLHMVLKLGGPEKNRNGIHMHMNVDREIYYLADDAKREVIKWVKSVDKNGKETVYTTADSPHRGKAPPMDRVRHMDCLDCHNRPSHRFQSPDHIANTLLAHGSVDRGLPAFKATAVDLLAATYDTESAAVSAIRTNLEIFYARNHPAYFKSHRPQIAEAQDRLSEEYRKNMFPEMKTRWDSHQEHLGHFQSQGCFRCHDGKHAGPDGKTISRDCQTCHTIIEQGPAGRVKKNLDGLPYEHPVDIGDAWKENLCSDCHTGGND